MYARAKGPIACLDVGPPASLLPPPHLLMTANDPSDRLANSVTKSTLGLVQKRVQRKYFGDFVSLLTWTCKFW